MSTSTGKTGWRVFCMDVDCPFYVNNLTEEEARERQHIHADYHRNATVAVEEIMYDKEDEPQTLGDA